MTNSNTVQQARDALATWRANAPSPLPWAIESDGQDNITVDARHVDIVQLSSREVSSWASLDDDDARLIVGTAGNPDLLDAIDGLLAQEQRRRRSMHTNMSHDLSHHAERIAIAIIAADERMSA